MTLKGRLRLIDALLYLKISGSVVVASTGVSKCVRENVCPRSLRRACGFLCRFHCLHCACVCAGTCFQSASPSLLFSLSTVGEEVSVSGQLGEIRWEQKITRSIWPGSGAEARRKGSTMMYRVVCQPDGAHGGGPLCACQQIHIFNSPPVGVLSMTATGHAE